MKIIVFDDNQQDLCELVHAIHSWKDKHNYSEVIVKSLHTPDSLLFSLPDIIMYDVFFLDIMTENDSSTGFRLAEKIHHQNPQAIVIFTTNSREYFESAFEISAFRYMLKPVNPQKIYVALDEAYSRTKVKHSHAFIFQSDRQRVIIRCDQILYVESITTDHRAKLILTNGSVTEISLSGTNFSSLIEDKLSDEFFQCHRSFIINLNYVKKYGRNIVILLDDTEIPVSNKYRADLTNRMIDHYKKAY